jgi:hypothetical protein
MAFDPYSPEGTPERKLLEIRKKINEFKRQIDRENRLDMPKSQSVELEEKLHPRQVRAILRAALAELEKLL